jgi:hypothetical protein
MDGLRAAENVNELRQLRDHWTDDSGRCAYQFSYDGEWIAARDGKRLAASSAAELRVLVADDYAMAILRA